jgi:Tol biopolymer transport system component
VALSGVVPARASFAGSNGHIAFVDGANNGLFSEGYLFTVRADGSGRTRITSAPAFSAPQWSPNGRRLAVEHSGDVWTMSPTGASLVRVTTNPADDFEPTWSPDGASLAFVSNRTGVRNIFVIHAAKPFGSPRQVTRYAPNSTGDVTDFATSPRWSPDGQAIMFRHWHSSGEEPVAALARVPAIGGAVTAIPTGSGHVLGSDFAPSGSQIAFSTFQDPFHNLAPTRLAVANDDGSSPRVLLADNGDPATHEARKVFGDVAWAPSGAYLVFTKGGTQSGLWRIRVADRQERQLSATGRQPAWQPFP